MKGFYKKRNGFMTFTRNLRKGTSDEDVLEVEK